MAKGNKATRLRDKNGRFIARKSLKVESLNTQSIDLTVKEMAGEPGCSDPHKTLKSPRFASKQTSVFEFELPRATSREESVEVPRSNAPKRTLDEYLLTGDDTHETTPKPKRQRCLNSEQQPDCVDSDLFEKNAETTIRDLEKRVQELLSLIAEKDKELEAYKRYRDEEQTNNHSLVALVKSQIPVSLWPADNADKFDIRRNRSQPIRYTKPTRPRYRSEDRSSYTRMTRHIWTAGSVAKKSFHELLLKTTRKQLLVKPHFWTSQHLSAFRVTVQESHIDEVILNTDITMPNPLYCQLTDAVMPAEVEVDLFNYATGNFDGYLPFQFGPVDLWPTEVRVHEIFGFTARGNMTWFPFLVHQDRLPTRVLNFQKGNVPGLAPYTVAQLLAVAQEMELVAKRNGKTSNNIIYKPMTIMPLTRTEATDGRERDRYSGFRLYRAQISGAYLKSLVNLDRPLHDDLKILIEDISVNQWPSVAHAILSEAYELYQILASPKVPSTITTDPDNHNTQFSETEAVETTESENDGSSSSLVSPSEKTSSLPNESPAILESQGRTALKSLETDNSHVEKKETLLTNSNVGHTAKRSKDEDYDVSEYTNSAQEETSHGNNLEKSESGDLTSPLPQSGTIEEAGLFITYTETDDSDEETDVDDGSVLKQLISGSKSSKKRTRSEDRESSEQKIKRVKSNQEHRHHPSIRLQKTSIEEMLSFKSGDINLLIDTPILEPDETRMFPDHNLHMAFSTSGDFMLEAGEEIV